MMRSLGEVRRGSRCLSEGAQGPDLACQRPGAGRPRLRRIQGSNCPPLELTQLSPPFALGGRLRCRAERRISPLKRSGRTRVPTPNRCCQEPRRWRRACCRPHAGEADSDLAAAPAGDAAAFADLDREYRSNQVVVRERLYRDRRPSAPLGAAGSTRWIPAARQTARSTRASGSGYPRVRRSRRPPLPRKTKTDDRRERPNR